jgi:L-threonylcarbamoyladenylate synthase
MDSIEQAVGAIRAGQPIVLPTDTVYGLCASPYREEHIARIYLLKGRPETMPLSLLCSGLDMLFEALPELGGRPAAQARALLPGPYTLVLPNPERRFRPLNAMSPATIGVRVPVLAGDAKAIVERAGPLASTSANRHQGLDPKKLEDVPPEIREGCGALVDGGKLPGTPSTVIDLTGPQPRVLREGAGRLDDAFERLSAVAA